MSFQIQACIAAVLLACAGFTMAEPEPLRAAQNCGEGTQTLAYTAGMSGPSCAEKAFLEAAKKFASR